MIPQERQTEMSAPAGKPVGSAQLRPALGMFTVIMLVVGGVIGFGDFSEAGSDGGAAWVTRTFIGCVGAGWCDHPVRGFDERRDFRSDCGDGRTVCGYFEKMYGKFFAWLYGWSVFSVIQTASIAALAYVFAEYSTQFIRLPELSGSAAQWSFHVPFIGDIVPFREIGVKGMAVLVIAVLTTINYLGVRFGGLVQNVFTCAKLVGNVGAFLRGNSPWSGGSSANLQ